jgi:ribosomal protein L15E
MNYLTSLYDKRDKHFGNARSVRQMVGEVVKKQNLRLAGMEASKRTPEELETLNFDDVKHLEIAASENKQTLGFRLGGK